MHTVVKEKEEKKCKVGSEEAPKPQNRPQGHSSKERKEKEDEKRCKSGPKRRPNHRIDPKDTAVKKGRKKKTRKDVSRVRRGVQTTDNTHQGHSSN
ncbi:hypothetical protein Pcinc_018507 [Petrolisthes cinctipes]|uniref:Uncharacterized protein n=1 Tax=Petrolisthes cinctipes TaxID=88211 RepID=A0AAE1KMP2_PETCI|nr:hypothetical protein Pcinc_018507 [Petrolisthes cinctipes]